jgi:hypothetical protein
MNIFFWVVWSLAGFYELTEFSHFDNDFEKGSDLNINFLTRLYQSSSAFSVR